MADFDSLDRRGYGILASGDTLAPTRDTITRAAPGLQDGAWPPAHGFRDIQDYWRDARPFEAEQAERRAIFNAAMAAHDAREAARREARWAREGDA